MKKRLGSALLASIMAISMLAGCGAGAGSGAGTTTAGAAGSGESSAADGAKSGSADAKTTVDPAKVEKIKVYMPTSGKFDDLAMVMEKVNEITIPKIGVEVEFKVFEFGQWFQQYSLYLSGAEDIDILANYGGYLNAVSQGAAYDLTELLPEYGKDIMALEGDFIKSGMVGDVQYAIPIYASYSWNMGMIYRKDITDELGLTEQAENAKTLKDWEPILAAVKEAKPEMTPYVRNSGGNTMNFRYGLWDNLGNDFGVIMDPTNSDKVVNLFETEEYAELVGIMHDWYNKGYTNKDIQTQTDTFPVLTRNDAAFATLGQTDFNTAYYQSTTSGKPLGAVSFEEPVARTYNNVTYTIMSNSKHPEASMKFLNLWATDKELGTLISYGLEGTHYQLDENGMGIFMDGQDIKTTTYRLGSGVSNINRILWDSENPDYQTLLVENNTNSPKSKALGFAFNPENVANEITELNNVSAKYQIGLETGAMDPATYLPEFNAALKEAGLDKVIAEKQAQLDAYLGK